MTNLSQPLDKIKGLMYNIIVLSVIVVEYWSHDRKGKRTVACRNDPIFKCEWGATPHRNNYNLKEIKMEIMRFTEGSKDDALLMLHDNRVFSALISAMRNGDKIIGAYVAEGIPYFVYRNSVYGKQIMNAFNDSRKFNPEGYRIEI